MSNSKWCRCEGLRPYRRPNWDIDPEYGSCRTCSKPVHPKQVRKMHALAKDALSVERTRERRSIRERQAAA